MREQDVFVLADQSLSRVVEQITDDQWDMVMPDEFPMSAAVDRVVTLREVIGYHAYDDAWVPDMLAGRTMAEVGEDAFRGDLLGGTPVEAFAAIVGKACAAARATSDLSHTVHCSFGDYTAQQYLWQVNGFRGLRVHDIAKVLGLDPTLPPELVEGLWEEIAPNAEEWRSYGIFGPAVAVPADASLQDRLLGITGRQPDGA